MTMKIEDMQAAENKAANEVYQQVNKLSGYEVIENVFEHTESRNFKKLPDGTVTNDVVSLGWFIRVAGSSAVCVGKRKPPDAFKRGARVKVSVELAPVPPPEVIEAVQEPQPNAPVDHAANYGGQALAKAAEFRGEEIAVASNGQIS